MKKLSVVFIVMTLLLSACSSKTNKLYDLERERPTLETVKCVTEKENYSTYDTLIRYSITNISEEETWINPDNECFELQKLVDGKWKWVGTKIDHFWTELAMLLPPGQTQTREIELSKYFYLPLEKGEYRIVVENIISNTFEIS